MLLSVLSIKEDGLFLQSESIKIFMRILFMKLKSFNEKNFYFSLRRQFVGSCQILI